MGRFLLIFVTLLIPTMFFAYPPILEQSDGECSALQQRAADLASLDGAGQLTVSPLYGASASEPNGAAFARDRYPLLPATLGCAVAFWQSVIAGVPPAAAAPATPPVVPPPAPPSMQPMMSRSPAPPGNARNAVVAIMARDITPNGDPTSPGIAFSLPMNAVAIRVEYPPGTAGALRFRLFQGKATLSTCIAQKAAPGIAWCKFDVGLRKGVYWISFTAGNATLGQFAFTVFGQ